jgi:hypothetical protein
VVTSNFTANIVRVVKWRKIMWTRHVVRMREVRCAYRILVWKREGKRHLGEIAIDGKADLKWILRK